MVSVQAFLEIEQFESVKLYLAGGPEMTDYLALKIGKRVHAYC